MGVATTLKCRREFNTVTEKGVKYVTPFFVTYVFHDPLSPLRYGLIVTKKIGNAVVRNRAKRRLRALMRLPAIQDQPPFEIVFIARNALITAPFDQISHALLKSINHAKKATA